MVVRFSLFYLSLEHESIFSNMDNVQKQRENIVLYKDKRDGQDCIRIEYSNSQAIALLLAQDTEIKVDANSCAYMPASTFRLPAFYDRYSPHAYIDYSRVYVRHPKPKREYILPKGYLELLEQKRYSSSTIKAYKIYFSDFMEYHKRRDLDQLTIEDINTYMLYMVKEKHISVTQQNMRINAIKFYSQLTCIKHRCIISLIYSAKLHHIKLLNLTPQDFMIAGIKHRAYLHMLDQSFTTCLFEQETDLKSIQELMRYNNVKTTSIHLYASNVYKAKTPNLLDYFDDT